MAAAVDANEHGAVVSKCSKPCASGGFATQASQFKYLMASYGQVSVSADRFVDVRSMHAGRRGDVRFGWQLWGNTTVRLRPICWRA